MSTTCSTVCQPKRTPHSYPVVPKLAFLVLLSLAWLSGCTSVPSEEPSVTEETPLTETHSPEEVDAQDYSDDLQYNLNKLSDPDYTQTYGDGENDKIWYIAAENLGQIGKQAVPHLIEKLDSADEFEVMLALYALQLASQDSELQAQTNHNYLSLPSVLNPRANARNRAIALSWWQEYEHLWNDDD